MQLAAIAWSARQGDVCDDAFVHHLRYFSGWVEPNKVEGPDARVPYTHTSMLRLSYTVSCRCVTAIYDIKFLSRSLGVINLTRSSKPFLSVSHALHG